MRLAMVLCVLLLSGCGVTFENRVACTSDRSTAIFVSMYGPIGIASTIEESDAAHVCSQARR